MPVKLANTLAAGALVAVVLAMQGKHVIVIRKNNVNYLKYMFIFLIHIPKIVHQACTIV